jgi:hypothetical protein
MLEAVELVRKAKAERNISIKAPLGKVDIKSPVALNEDMTQDIMNAIAGGNKSDSFESLTLEGKNVKLEIEIIKE